MTDDKKPAPPPNSLQFANNFTKRVPDGDSKARLVCDNCDFVHYQNPKIVVGSVVVHEGKILMGKRSIEPRHGFWTLPAGFMEEGETVEQGAMREAREEMEAEIVLENLLAVYSIPRISQVQIMYTASLKDGSFGVGEETLETALFGWDEIPWQQIAFPSVYWALIQYHQVKDQPAFAPFSNPEGEYGNTIPKGFGQKPDFL